MPRRAPIDAGEKNRQIVIQRRTTAAGTSRYPVESWTTLATVWAAKYDIGGREQTLGGGGTLSARADARFEITYRADMDPDVIAVPADRRIVLNGRAWDITAANLIGQRDGIELLVVAGKNVEGV